jgi:hypothetical protein
MNNNSNSIQFKVSYKSETKKFKKPDNFEGLVSQTVRAFGTQNLPPHFKFFYMDSDEDLISISSQEDLEEAIESTQALRLIVAENAESARFSFEPDFSRGSINLPLQMSSTQREMN